LSFKTVKLNRHFKEQFRVNVTTTSGAPGAALDIRIRGIATNGENRPTTIDGYIGELGY
jgi:hypothetical protein